MRIRVGMYLSCLAIFVYVVPVSALDGTMLLWNNGRVYLRNVTTGAEVTLVSAGAANNARFSHDGRRVAVGMPTGLRVIPNNGVGYRDITLNPAPDQYLSWDSAGSIYWAPYDQPIIYKIDVAAGTQQPLSYRWNGGLRELTVAANGRRGIAFWHGNKGVWDCDLNVIDLINGGGRIIGCPCGPSISPSGIFFGQTWVDHRALHVTIIDSMPTLDRELDRSHYEYKVISGFPYDLSNPRWSSYSDDWAIGGGWNNNAYAYNWIIDVANGTFHMVGLAPAQIKDYWPGTLPPPWTEGPVIAVSPSTLNFSVPSSSVTPAPQSVTVTNAGSGTLGKVQASEQTVWLTVTVEGNGGNTQTLTNTVNPSGLASGTHTATVTVSGGGATNSASYTVVLTVAAALPAPSGLTAQYTRAGEVALAWQDNSTTESAFVIHRRVSGGVWAEIARRPANATTHVDTVPEGNLTYEYRVRAVAGSDTSSWSNVAAVTVPGLPTITLTAPVAGTVYRPGDTIWIRWTAANVTSVGLKYSLDDGDYWRDVPLIGGAGGSVSPSNPYWGNYPFVAPDTFSTECRIMAYDYMDHQVSVLSGLFTITRGTGVRAGVHPSPQSSAYPGPRVVAAGMERWIPQGQWYSLQGARIRTGEIRAGCFVTIVERSDKR